jgi:hypothetical protein
MKKLSLVGMAVLVMLGAANAFATCPTPPSGPGFFLGLEYYDYSQDAACYSFYGSGSASSTTLDCGYSGWQLNSGNYSAMRASFTIGSSDPVLNSSHWKVDTYITAISPSHTSFDYFALTVYVTHPNNSPAMNTYTMYTWNGSQADLTGCNLLDEAYFSANTGDTVTVEVRATILAGSGATIKATPVTITNTQ